MLNVKPKERIHMSVDEEAKFKADWDSAVERLRNSGADLSRIPITKSASDPYKCDVKDLMYQKY